MCMSMCIDADCGYTLIRVWTAHDNCGNTASESQVLTVIDSTDPELHGVPADITIECDQDVPDAIVFATDNCSDNLIVALTAETVDQDCGHLLIRTWTTVDECGNETSESQTVTVVDTTAPYVVDGVPAEVTIECDQTEPTDMPTFGDA